MPKPYSQDLRDRVISTYETGSYTQAEVAKQFKIGAKTVYDWLRLKEKTGSLKPKEGYQKGHSHVIEDTEAFKKLVSEGNFSSREEIVAAVGKGTVHSIGRALKKIGYVKKKDKIL
jgi:transposase